jgi:hypothetical protein
MHQMVGWVEFYAKKTRRRANRTGRRAVSNDKGKRGRCRFGAGAADRLVAV